MARICFFVPIVFSLVIVVGLIMIHHAITHEGHILQLFDFQNAFYNLGKSHEGIIVSILLAGSGVIVGIFITKKRSNLK